MSSPYKLPEGNVRINFSGGRTSGYMLHEILVENGDLPERCEVVFSNTGREMNETLDFVNECSVRWNVPITWLEYTITNKKPSFEVVSHNSASRKGEPFAAVIKHNRRLPSPYQRFCTKELKVNTMRRYARERGWATWTTAIGIRADEAHRAIQKDDSKETCWYPLNAAHIAQGDIMEFWGKQRMAFGFDLKITKGFGNCDGCFLKSEKNLAALWRLHPDRAQWWADQENLIFEGKEGKSQFQRFKGQVDRAASYAELGDFVERQGDWIFDDENFLCQADGGECTG